MYVQVFGTGAPRVVLQCFWAQATEEGESTWVPFDLCGVGPFMFPRAAPEDTVPMPVLPAAFGIFITQAG